MTLSPSRPIQTGVAFGELVGHECREMSEVGTVDQLLYFWRECDSHLYSFIESR